MNIMNDKLNYIDNTLKATSGITGATNEQNINYIYDLLNSINK